METLSLDVYESSVKNSDNLKPYNSGDVGFIPVVSGDSTTAFDWPPALPFILWNV